MILVAALDADLADGTTGSDVTGQAAVEVGSVLLGDALHIITTINNNNKQVNVNNKHTKYAIVSLITPLSAWCEVKVHLGQQLILVHEGEESHALAATPPLSLSRNLSGKNAMIENIATSGQTVP